MVLYILNYKNKINCGDVNMQIREIKKEDNVQIESVIRSAFLIEHSRRNSIRRSRNVKNV